MRSIYLNDRCVWVNVSCGVFPITKCPVQIYAKKNNIECTKKQEGFFDKTIRLHTKLIDKETVTMQIRSACNNCKFDDIKQNIR